jgi:hypothetical protein
MKTHETTTSVRAFDRAYINGRFVAPHGAQVVDLVNRTDNKVKPGNKCKEERQDTWSAWSGARSTPL